MLGPSDFNNAVPQFTNGDYASNPINPQYIAEPDAENYNRGSEPLQTLPAQWWNWFLNRFTNRFNKVNIYVKNIFNEITQLLSLVSVTPSGTEDSPTVGQLKDMFETKYPDYLKTTSALSNTYVPQTTKVNGHALSDNVTVTRSDLGLGTSATLDAGSAVGNVPVVGTALGTTNGNILMTDANGKLKPSGITTGTSAGNIPLIGTALGTTNNNIVVTDTSGQLKPSGTTIGSAAGKTAGSAKGNVPLINSSAGLGTTDGNIVVTDTSGNLKASGKKVGTAAGNVPEIGTALGSTNNNIVVTDASGKLKPSGTTIGSAAGKTAGSALGNVPLVGISLAGKTNSLITIDANGALQPNADTDTKTIANLKTYIKNQNILSSWESVSIPVTTSSTPPSTQYTAEYDGFLNVYSEQTSIRDFEIAVYVDNTLAYYISGRASYVSAGVVGFPFKKGQKIYLRLWNASSIANIKCAFYKDRDYTGR